MKKATGLMVLLLAALLVAMPAAASALVVFNEADALMLGTKINIQEEVGSAPAVENMAVAAVNPSEGLAVLSILIALAGFGACAVHYMRSTAIRDGYKPTSDAGGDGLLARFS